MPNLSGKPRNGGQEFTQADKAMKPEKSGKKFNTKALANAVRKKPKQPADPEAEAMRKGGYSPGNGGVGSG
jgi:hypothetical protein